MVRRLVYVESTTDIRTAIQREKEIKGWRRSKKIALIDSANPEWADLAVRWFEDVPLPGGWGSLAALGMTICSTGKMRIPRCARD